MSYAEDVPRKRIENLEIYLPFNNIDSEFTIFWDFIILQTLFNGKR